VVSAFRTSGGANSQSAARYLIIMDKLGETPTPTDLALFPQAMKVIRATSRLAKLDFWVRNPDYLADELLTDIENGSLDAKLGLPHAERLLTGSAPLMHLYPMQRYKYGAWELPDNAFAVLKYLGLADQKRVLELGAEGATRARRDYFLFREGAARVVEMRAQVPQTEWYDQQADAIALLNVGSTGAAAKLRQYDQPDYASTPIGATIGPILDRVRERFVEIAGQHDYTVPPALAAVVGRTDV
jgi:hypothetical protein